MLSLAATKLDEIFVGRHEELRLLEALWKQALNPVEHFVYVMLNAPGTGKTRFLRQFGELLEHRQEGLYFHYQCSSSLRESSELNANLVKRILDEMNVKLDWITTYISTSYSPLLSKEKEEELHVLRDRMKLFLRSGTLTLANTVEILHDLSVIIPVFFVADEIQEFQKAVITIDEASTIRQSIEEETALHYFTRILKDLMRSRILMVLSGTQYHILSQIGIKIGSPIAQKVKPIAIRNFTPGEIDEYVDVVKTSIIRPVIEEEKSDPRKLSVIDDYYRKFLHSFSGGHPRTIAFITEQFFGLLPTHLWPRPHVKYEEFVSMLFSKVEEEFKPRIFSREQQELVQELQASEKFLLVKEWIINKAHEGYHLGSRPKASSWLEQEEIDHLVFQLMTIGVIVQNGAGDYHLTSYFHLLAFLECFMDDHVLILRRVLHDRLFKILCGGHAGLGYTFEHVFLAILWIHSRQIKTPIKGWVLKPSETLKIPLNLDEIVVIKELSGDVVWDQLEIQPQVLYHVPRAKAIDMFIMSSENLLLIQLTTTIHPSLEKLRQLARAVSDVGTSNPGKQVLGWFVSLFDVPHDKLEPEILENIIITDGRQVSLLLGKELYERLIQIKKELP